MARDYLGNAVNATRTKGATMARVKAVKRGAGRQVLQAVSYAEKDGFGDYSATELERQDKENEKALEGLDKRYSLGEEYDGTQFAQLAKDEIEMTKDPNAVFCFYEKDIKLEKKGVIHIAKSATCFRFTLDGDKQPFLIIGAKNKADIITVGKYELPAKMPCPSGVQIIGKKVKKVACIIVKGATLKREYTFTAGDNIYFGYIGKATPPKDIAVENFG